MPLASIPNIAKVFAILCRNHFKLNALHAISNNLAPFTAASPYIDYRSASAQTLNLPWASVCWKDFGSAFAGCIDELQRSLPKARLTLWVREEESTYGKVGLVSNVQGINTNYNTFYSIYVYVVLTYLIRGIAPVNLSVRSPPHASITLRTAGCAL